MFHMLSRIFHALLRFVDVSAVVACQAVANIVKSSLGPVGLDKVSISSVHVIFFFIILVLHCYDSAAVELGLTCFGYSVEIVLIMYLWQFYVVFERFSGFNERPFSLS